MKGIILAGGSGTRLHPLTLTVSKQLLPVYDKPMIYYPISVLLLAGIREILIISTPNDLPNFKTLLGDGSNLGVEFSYREQPSPDGLAQAFVLGEDFIKDDDVCLILGDNIFYSEGLISILKNAIHNAEIEKKATVFGHYVKNPSSFGVVNFDENDNILSFEEKPISPKSNHAVVGLYFYPNSVIGIAKKVKPSKRGELEITSVNNVYLERNEICIELMGRGFAWLDTGSFDSLIQASNFIKTVEELQSLKIACLEEIAFQMGYIDKEQLKNLATSGKNINKSNYLLRLLEK
ncbi:glucose-1-phosphate thymidylyltransferase RfbA [bacterium]|nr:glucose-1-phosphate thymidylyltransferase RfbA [bacterium]